MPMTGQISEMADFLIGDSLLRHAGGSDGLRSFSSANKKGFCTHAFVIPWSKLHANVPLPAIGTGVPSNGLQLLKHFGTRIQNWVCLKKIGGKMIISDMVQMFFSNFLHHRTCSH